MKVIKSHTYNVVNTDPFDMPAPLEFEMFCGNSLLAAYKINEDGRVDYSYNPASNDKVLTSTHRPLDMRDIYFLFSSRVFPDKTPFTRNELDRFGIEEYNPYEIMRKTHGILPADRYWFKFSDETLSYKKASEDFNSYFVNPVSPSHADSGAYSRQNGSAGEHLDPIHTIDSILNQKSNEFTSLNDVSSILKQNTLDIAALSAGICEPGAESANAPSGGESSGGGNMTPEQIAELLGGGAASKPEPPEESGGNLTPEQIAELLEGTHQND
ncbi:MAG: hypothetical protein LBI38_07365 [Oscillospiraceae bacterium]|jgi:hypothetical protein|nr:hypothetical protein [Oscillospiraceae bacterium]